MLSSNGNITLRSIAKQVTPTYEYIYMNHSQPLIPAEIHYIFNQVWEEREARPILICWALSNDAAGTILITSLVWRGRGSNPRPPFTGQMLYHWATATKNIIF